MAAAKLHRESYECNLFFFKWICELELLLNAHLIYIYIYLFLLLPDMRQKENETEKEEYRGKSRLMF